MTFDSPDILVIGDLPAGTGEMLRRFSHAGRSFRHARTLREARELLGWRDLQLVLSAEALSDGRGYDLAGELARRARTLIVGVPLSESCLWLPVVYRGVNVLGHRALAPEMLEAEMRDLLGLKPAAALNRGVREFGRRGPLLTAPLAARRRSAAPPSALGALGPQRSAPAAGPAGLLRRRYRDRDKTPALFA